MLVIMLRAPTRDAPTFGPPTKLIQARAASVPQFRYKPNRWLDGLSLTLMHLLSPAGLTDYWLHKVKPPPAYEASGGQACPDFRTYLRPPPGGLEFTGRLTKVPEGVSCSGVVFADLEGWRLVERFACLLRLFLSLQPSSPPHVRCRFAFSPVSSPSPFLKHLCNHNT